MNNYELLCRVLDGLQITEIISGGAKGADSLAERYAKERGHKITVYPADWETYGRSAGAIRNELIVLNCDQVIAFWDGKSPGTKITIRLARKYNRPTMICGIS